MLKSKSWPRPIIEFYRGERSAESMVAAAENTEQRCDAQFYLAQYQIVQDKRAEAREALRSGAIADCPKHLFEYLGAQVDLKRIAQ